MYKDRFTKFLTAHAAETTLVPLILTGDIPGCSRQGYLALGSVGRDRSRRHDTIVDRYIDEPTFLTTCSIEGTRLLVTHGKFSSIVPLTVPGVELYSGGPIASP